MFWDYVNFSTLFKNESENENEIETYSIEQIVSRAKKPGLLVALDGIQDPHNVGAILRTCDAIGVDGVIIGRFSVIERSAADNRGRRYAIGYGRSGNRAAINRDGIAIGIA